MSFNPVTWNSTQPLPTQNISAGQGTIRTNFDFLQDATGNVAPGFIELPSGLIIQWGRTGELTVGNNFYIFNSTTGANSISIQPFPTTCFAIYFQPISSSPNNKVPPCVGPATGPDDLQRDRVKIYIATGSAYTAGAYVLAIGN